MSNALSEALLILAVGMVTVFVILGMVVMTGQVLIRITNRFTQEVQVAKPTRSVNRSKAFNKSATIDKKKLAALVATVELITEGRGRIEKIEKM